MSQAMRSACNCIAISRKKNAARIARGTSLLNTHCLLLTAHCLLTSVSSIVTMSLSNLVRVQRAAASADQRANRRAFLSTGDAADCRAPKRAAGHGQLIAVFLPESPV